jgi:hypothetical protein
MTLVALLELRARNPEFQRLQKGPWALFIGIAVHWQGNAEAWPGQDTLGRFTGWSTRAVRDQADSLERGGFIRVRRERRADGSERILYAPGLVTLAALADFVERFPRERARFAAPPTRTAEPTGTHPPEAAAGTPPEAASGELRDQDQNKPSSCEAAPASARVAEGEEQERQVTQEDREVARTALTERMARKYPTRAPPRWFDAGEVTLVAACASALEGDREAKMRSLSDAFRGAFVASKDGPPTVRFIWGKFEHFLDHVNRGRCERLADERNERLRASPDRASHASSSHSAAAATPAVARAQMAADLERLFGPGWTRARVR